MEGARRRFAFLLLTFIFGLFPEQFAKANSALTDQNFGGVGGVYHVETEHFAGVGIVEVLLVPITGQEFDLCFWFRSKALGDQDWEYSDGYKCAPLRPFPSQSVGCQIGSYCFTANLDGVDYFFDFSPDYHLVDHIVWKNAGSDPDVFRLYRKQDETYESWLREFSDEDFPQGDHQSSFQMYGTGFVVGQDYVVTADHILRDKDSRRQCNRVEVLTDTDKRWAPAKIHGVNPLLDIAVIKLAEPRKSVAYLSFAPRFDNGDFVSHYSFVDWSNIRKGSGLSSGQIVPNPLNERSDLEKIAIFSDLPGQGGDSGGAMLDVHGNVVGVLLAGDESQGFMSGLKSSVLEGFLAANRVPFEVVKSSEVLSPEEVEKKAETFTAFVRCRHRGAGLDTNKRDVDRR